MTVRPHDLLPSFTEYRLDFPIEPNYITTNASVEIFGGVIYALVPAMDHWINASGIFAPLPAVRDKHPTQGRFARNITYLARLDSDLAVTSAVKLTLPMHQTPRTPWPFRGFESPRLFAWPNGYTVPQLWATLCTHGCGKTEGAQFYIGRVDNDRFMDVRRVSPEPRFRSQFEKNWMPEIVNGHLRFHHRIGTLIELDGTLIPVGTEIEDLHGGTQVIPYKNGTLCIVHRYGSTTQQSFQQFARLNIRGQLVDLSEPFNFHRDIATGMAYHPDGKRMIISYGRQDADENNVLRYQETPYLATVTLSDLESLI